MNKDNLLAFPLIEDLEYRSNINTTKLNLMLRSIEESTLRALLRGNEASQQMNQIGTAINASYKALGRGTQLYNYYASAANTGSDGCLYATSYGAVNGRRQDNGLGIVTMDWEEGKKLSKIPIVNGVLSPVVQIYVDGVLRNQDDPVYNILNSDESSFWIEAASTGLHTVQIVLPPSTQEIFNFVEVLPFPIFGVGINKITYEDDQSVNQTIFDDGAPLFYNSTCPLALHLAPKQYNNIITLTLESFATINVIGLTKVDISYISYLNNTNTFYMSFESLPKVKRDGSSITNLTPTGIELDFHIDGLNDNFDPFFSEISLVNKIVNPTTISLKTQTGYQSLSAGTININAETPNALYLKVVMNEVGLTSPMFRGAKLYYNL